MFLPAAHRRPAPTDAARALCSFLAEAVAEVMAHYGAPVAPVGPDDTPPGIAGDDVLGAISFRAHDLEGTVLLVTSPSVAEATLPAAPDAALREAHALEWVGELANQVLGRVKDRALRRGAALEVGLPHACRLSEFAEPLDPVYMIGEPLVGPGCHVFAWCVLRVGPAFWLALDTTDDARPSHARRQLF